MQKKTCSTIGTYLSENFGSSFLNLCLFLWLEASGKLKWRSGRPKKSMTMRQADRPGGIHTTSGGAPRSGGASGALCAPVHILP